MSWNVFDILLAPFSLVSKTGGADIRLLSVTVGNHHFFMIFSIITSFFNDDHAADSYGVGPGGGAV